MLPATLTPTAPPELAALSTADLRRALAASLRRTAEELVRLAWIVRLLEERGEDLEDLRLGLLGYLRRIAYGQTLPEVVVRFADRSPLVRRIAALPLADQRHLAEGGLVTLVVRRGDQFDHRQADPLRLTTSQIDQVFGRDQLRDEPAQILYLEAHPERPAKAARRPGRVAADRRRGGVRIGRSFAPAAELVAALAELRTAPADPEAPAERTVAIKLTDAEHYNLKRRALDGRTEISTLVHRALAAYGLLAPVDDPG